MNNNKFAYIGKPLAKIIDKLATLSDYNSSTKRVRPKDYCWKLKHGTLYITKNLF